MYEAKLYEEPSLYFPLTAQFPMRLLDIIPPLMDSPFSRKDGTPSRTRDFFFDIMFQPKSRVSVLKWGINNNTERSNLKKIKSQEKNPLILERFKRESFSPKIRGLSDIRANTVEPLDNFIVGEKGYYDYKINKKQWKKPIAFDYVDFGTWMGNLSISNNPYYRYFFVFAPLYKKYKGEELSKNLILAPQLLSEIFNTELKLFEMIVRLKRFSISNDAEDLTIELWSNKSLEKDMEKLVFEHTPKDKIINPLGHRLEPAKKEFTTKWLEEKKEEFKKFVYSVLEEEFKYEKSPEEEKYLQEEQEKRNAELLKEIKESKKLNIKQKEK